jgi:uncharacterized protein
MQSIVALFWNRGEQRIPAFWRIVLHMVLRFVLLFAFVQAIRVTVIGLGWLPADASLAYVHKTWNPDAPWSLTVKKGAEFAAALISTFLAARMLDRRRFSDLGFALRVKMWWLDLLFGMAAGAISIGVVIWIGISLGWIAVTGRWVTANTNHSLFAWLAWWFLACLLNGVEEELADGHAYLMRNTAEGLTNRRLSGRCATLAAFLGSNAFFGLGHVSAQEGMRFVVYLTVVGVFFGLAYLLTGELAVAIGIHTTWNFVQLFCAHPGGAEGEPIAALMTVQYHGHELWTGAAQGTWRLESGFLILIASALGIAMSLAWVRLTRGTLRIAAERFAYPPAS